MRPIPVPPASGIQPDEVLAAAAESVRRAEVDSPWLSAVVQADPPRGRWVGRDELLADDARGLAELVAGMRAGAPGVDPRLAWRSVVGATAWPLGWTMAQTLARTGRLVAADADAVRYRPAVHGASIDAVWLRRVSLLVGADDPLAGAPSGVTVAGPQERLEALATALAALIEPVVAIVAPRAGTGRRALWGSVTDAVLGAFAEPRDGDRGPADQHARVAQVADAFRATPLALAPRWTDFTHGGAARTCRRYAVCCMAYKWPADPDAAPRPDGLDRRWDRYCGACPLIPDAEVVHRARHRLEHPDGDH